MQKELRKKIREGKNKHLTPLILDYLTNWPQCVRTWDYMSDRIICSTGALQETVLAPWQTVSAEEAQVLRSARGTL